MGRAFATGLPPLRDFADSLSRYRYLVARAQLADLARLTLGSRPPELLRQRLLRLPAAAETPPLRFDAAPRASRSRAWPRAARATFPDPLLARQAAKRSAERPPPLLRPALCSAAPLLLLLRPVLPAVAHVRAVPRPQAVGDDRGVRRDLLDGWQRLGEPRARLPSAWPG